MCNIQIKTVKILSAHLIKILVESHMAFDLGDAIDISKDRQTNLELGLSLFKQVT